VVNEGVDGAFAAADSLAWMEVQIIIQLVLEEDPQVENSVLEAAM